MKFNVLLLLTLFLCNCCSGRFTLEKGLNTDLAKNTKNISTTSANQLQLIDLNADVFFLILDNLDLISLLRMGQTSKHISHLVYEYVSRYLSLKEVRISGGYTGRSNPKSSIWLGKECIHFRNLNVAMRILKVYGSKIKNLVIFTDDFSAEKQQTIANHINEYCANSLISLELFGLRSFFALLTELSAVEDLKLTFSLEQAENGKKALNEIFPNLRRLSVDAKSDMDTALLNCTLPNLEHFKVKLPSNQNPLANTEIIEQFFRINSHIRSIDLDSLPLSFLDTVNELLPHLDEISIRSFLSNDRPSTEICFENVKTFKFDNTIFESYVHDDFIASYVKCPNLNEFRMIYKKNRPWHEFFANHKNITKLIIRVNHDTNEFNLQPFLQLEQLRELSIVFRLGIIPAEDVIRFIDSHEKLTRCQFAMLDYDENYVNLIRNTLEANWKISNFGIIKVDRFQRDLKGFSLERR